MNANIDPALKALHYVTSEIHALYHEVAVRFHLSDSALLILYTLCVNDGKCLLQEIYRISGTCRQTINSAIRKLEQEQLIFLDYFDGKKKVVYFSEAGKALSEKTVLRLIALEHEILHAWSVEEQSQYLLLSKRYLEDMKVLCKKL